MALEVKGVVDRGVGGEELLGRGLRLEPLLAVALFVGSADGSSRPGCSPGADPGGGDDRDGAVRITFAPSIQARFRALERTKKRRDSAKDCRPADLTSSPVGHKIQLAVPIVALT